MKDATSDLMLMKHVMLDQHFLICRQYNTGNDKGLGDGNN